MRKWKIHLIKSFKVALAAVIAIWIAQGIGLQYATTAGIITVLGIQNTKKETLKSARNRGLAFLAAMIIAAVCFGIFGYTLGAFALYLFLFAFLCLQANWWEAIAMDSVLITHFLTEGSMGDKQLKNELLLFLIGTGLSILANLHLRKKETEFQRLAAVVDEQIKGILKRMSLWLPEEDKSDYGSDCFISLQIAVEEARKCALSNYNNELLEQDTRELDYIRMREQQGIVLQEIYHNIKAIDYLPEQVVLVAGLFDRIEQGFHMDNTVEGLLGELEALLSDMKKQKLPENREEFEARAILFYILMQIKKLLGLKREFIEKHCM